MGGFFPKIKLFMRGQNFLGQKNYCEVVPNSSTNDQMMPRFERIFINDKCIF